MAGPPQPPPEVAACYPAFAEEDRLASGAALRTICWTSRGGWKRSRRLSA